ncbi:uncharacterized protein J8A68_002657 [[Candida] subhashii]|uniref:Zn(2)-C6 fungal-type domain-containing protein n=1 Tax=[Candida] subhashii TaxID=561895 RepID=A0A8J5UPT3_9ASCO|nr:uncharacterized protein J8A68_002657 [[Candida] subhashii]KAG7663797.1 hypothetical protein J8A68_002657 [[Candida] subhashii]
MTPVSPEPDSFASKWRQVRACARCRRLKMKCFFEDPRFESCSRCSTAGFKCSIDEDPSALLSRRKRKKASPKLDTKSNSALAEFESASKRALTYLNNKTALSELPYDQVQGIIKSCKDIVSRLESSTSVLKSDEYPTISYSENLVKQVIELDKSFTIEGIRRRFHYFINNIVPYYPIISFSNDLKDFDTVLEKHPLLLAACISVTALNNFQPSLISESIPNSKLYNMMAHYLYESIAYHVYIKCNNFEVQLIYACLIVSLWCLPPNKFGHFRNQLNTLTAFNISMCIGLNEVPKCESNTLLTDSSEIRNNLRAMLSVYCTCGSLEMSLRRFKIVSWTKSHERAIELLMRPGDGLPTLEDRYICYVSRLMSTGQDILEFIQSLSNETEKGQGKGTVSLSRMREKTDSYELGLATIMKESGFDHAGKSNNKEECVFRMQHHYLIITIYESLINSALSIINSKAKDMILDSNVEASCLGNINKLITIWEELLADFTKLNQAENVNYPTTLYYKPFHALILLIRLRISLKSHNFVNLDKSVLEIDIESYFDKISTIINNNITEHGSLVCTQMVSLLAKIEKWMKLSKLYATSTDGSLNDLANIIAMNKGKEIETLEVPKTLLDAPSRRLPNIELKSQSILPSSESTISQSVRLGESDSSSYEKTIERLLQEFDMEIIDFLKDTDSSMDFLPLNTGNLWDVPGSSTGLH